MNYFVSQIVNFERHNVHTPPYFLERACVDIARDYWMDDDLLAQSILNDSLDLDDITGVVNEAFINADSVIQFDEEQVKEILTDWAHTIVE
jgi:hypothetical protein